MTITFDFEGIVFSAIVPDDSGKQVLQSFLGVTGISLKLDQVTKGLSTLMATYADDEARLEKDITAQSADIELLKTYAQTNVQAYSDLKTAFDAYKAANPAIDTTAMEAALSKMEANNSAVEGIVTPPATTTAPSTPVSDGSTDTGTVTPSTPVAS